MIRVVVAEDDLLVRNGVVALLGLEDDLDVVGQFADADGVLASLGETTPDVVLTDIRMPPTHIDEGVRLAERLRSVAPEVGVVVLSGHLDPVLAIDLLGDRDDAGRGRGRGYLLKERLGDPSELFEAIRAVAAGGSWVDSTVIESLVARRNGHDPGGLTSLTIREREVLGEVATGRSNAAVARALFISERSVEKHIASIFIKLGIRDDGTTNRRVIVALRYLANRTAT